jgi:histidinol-phosphate aminotransferase
LKLCAVAFTGRDKKVVVANPTFESIARHASVANADVVKIDLTSDFRHDLDKMLTATGNAGLVYICNPNNPTASITPRPRYPSFSRRYHAQRQCSSMRHITIMLTLKTTRV